MLKPLPGKSGRGYVATKFPPDPAFLAFEINRSVTEKATSIGDANMGDLVSTRPRKYGEDELTAARMLSNTLDSESPKHITDLIQALVTFEEYSVSRSVENWRDATIHSCIYAYTSQARWLMEKSLSAVLEARNDEFQEKLKVARCQHKGT